MSDLMSAALLPTDKLQQNRQESRDFQESDTRHGVFFSHRNIHLYVKKGSWGSELLAVASQRVYIRGGREIYCESYDHQQTAVLASSHCRLLHGTVGHDQSTGA